MCRLYVTCGITGGAINGNNDYVFRLPGPSIGDGFTNAEEARWFPTNLSSVSGSTDAVVEWKFIVDITGLRAGGNIGDVIGNTTSANAHFGQLLASEVGTIFGAKITCLEDPVGAARTIDIYSADEGTGRAGAGIALQGLTNVRELFAKGAVWTTLDQQETMIPLPNEGQYLYLVQGDDTDAGVYTTGRFLFTFYGTMTR